MLGRLKYLRPMSKHLIVKEKQQKLLRPCYKKKSNKSDWLHKVRQKKKKELLN